MQGRGTPGRDREEHPASPWVSRDRAGGGAGGLPCLPEARARQSSRVPGPPPGAGAAAAASMRAAAACPVPGARQLRRGGTGAAAQAPPPSSSSSSCCASSSSSSCAAPTPPEPSLGGPAVATRRVPSRVSHPRVSHLAPATPGPVLPGCLTPDPWGFGQREGSPMLLSRVPIPRFPGIPSPEGQRACTQVRPHLPQAVYPRPACYAKVDLFTASGYKTPSRGPWRGVTAAPNYSAGGCAFAQALRTLALAGIFSPRALFFASGCVGGCSWSPE